MQLSDEVVPSANIDVSVLTGSSPAEVFVHSGETYKGVLGWPKEDKLRLTTIRYTDNANGGEVRSVVDC